MLRRFAKHLAEDPGDSLQLVMEANALLCIHRVLDMMPPNEETLRSLSNELATEPSVFEFLSMRLKRNFERNIWAIRTKEKDRVLPQLRQELVKKAANDKLKKDALSLTDAELLRLIRKPYAEFIDSVLDTLASDMPYEQTYAKIKSLGKELEEKAEDNPAITWVIGSSAAGEIHRRYGIHVAHKAHINAVKAAIEIYLLKTTTGRLPDALPNGLPKDPFSGKDFEYKITKDGFVLRCRAKAVNVREVIQYEFKLQKQR